MKIYFRWVSPVLFPLLAAGWVRIFFGLFWGAKLEIDPFVDAVIFISGTLFGLFYAFDPTGDKSDRLYITIGKRKD